MNQQEKQRDNTDEEGNSSFEGAKPVKPKTVVTAVLLLFVAVSIVYLVVKEMGDKPADNVTQAETNSLRSGQEQGSPPFSERNTAATAKVVVYYFHGNARCMTCRTIEAYTKEAIESGFADALKAGRLEWRAVNVDDPGNEHFIEDFQLTTRSVVLELVADGKRQEWKNLQRVWDLIGGDKEEFLKYIKDEANVYLARIEK